VRFLLAGNATELFLAAEPAVGAYCSTVFLIAFLQTSDCIKLYGWHPGKGRYERERMEEGNEEEIEGQTKRRVAPRVVSKNPLPVDYIIYRVTSTTDDYGPRKHLIVLIHRYCYAVIEVRRTTTTMILIYHNIVFKLCCISLGQLLSTMST